MNKVLVTGGTGFVGSHIVKQLAQKGFELFCSIRKNSDIKLLQTLSTKLFEVDWNDKRQLTDIVGKVDYIIHCAATTSAISESQYHDGNVIPTVALLEAAKEKRNIKRFIFISTQAAAGPSDGEKPLTEDSDCHPISDYGKTKLIAEREVLKYQHDFPVSILRPCSIYGPASTEFHPLFKLVKSHLAVVIGDGRNKVNMISVIDFVEVVLRCLELDHPTGSVYFVTDGQEYDWNTIFRTAKEVYGKW
ncbi:MAG: NAD(P)-dependent oxidoreductase, partial [Spirochaetota bacterium]|nr:NAD(P)-dependent oxidoreductase [Spirochaetota bacterium]